MKILTFDVVRARANKTETQKALSWSPYPTNEVFELTMNSSVDEFGVVNDFAYYTEGWWFKGKRIPVGTTRRFKLVYVGYCRDLGELRLKLEQHGEIPSGIWMKIFADVFAPAVQDDIDEEHPIVGIADASWINRDEGECCPVIDPLGERIFTSANHHWPEHLLWLVAVHEEPRRRVYTPLE